MKIKRILIENYGPIEKFDLAPAAFELIHGLNEAGKTAIVEVLNYVLFKRTVKDLRYEKPHTMRVEIEDGGKIHKLPAKGTLLQLPAGDVTNLLYVQGSESSIFGSRDEASFWDGIKSMLSRVGKGISFTKLDEQVFEAVDLQPKRETWKREKQLRIDEENKRKAGLEVYLKRIGDIEKKEAELADLMEENKELRKKLDDVELYKRYCNYRELSNLYNRFTEKRTELQEYERYKREYLTEWQRSEAERRACLDAQAHLEEKKREASVLEKDIRELKAKEEMVKERDLKSYRGEPEQKPKGVPIIFSIALLLLAVVLFVASFFTRIPLLFSSSFLAAAALIFLYLFYRLRKTRRHLMDTDVLLQQAQEIFSDMASLSELSARIDKLEEEVIRKETLLQEKNKDVLRFSKEKTLSDIDAKLSVLRNKTGLAEMPDLEEKIAKRARIEESLTRLNANISERLHETDDRKWVRLIGQMKTIKPDKEPDLDMERDIKVKKELLQEKINGLTREIRLFREVEQAKYEIADDRAAFIEYDELDKKLRNYQLEEKAALAVRQILSSMSSELDEFIEEILSGEDSLSDYFNFVTERYGQVTVKNHDFVVADTAAKNYVIEDLSSGARDQLLLCFRMAALRRVYPDGAFLVLDDAFIFADWQRRRRLAQLLKKFLEGGNQVIYLTSDDHTRDLFAEYGAHITILG